MKLIAVNTQEKHDALMRELEAQGCKWVGGDLPTECDEWLDFKEESVICVNDNGNIYADIRKRAEKEYPDTPIIEYPENCELVESPQKPTVPKCFDDWVKENIKDNYDTAIRFYELICQYIRNDLDDELDDWFADNKETALEAFQHGYNVEKEQLYYVKLPSVPKRLAYLNSCGPGMVWFGGSKSSIIRTKFTESEIREIDEGYWAFAVRVEEDA